MSIQFRDLPRDPKGLREAAFRFRDCSSPTEDRNNANAAVHTIALLLEVVADLTERVEKLERSDAHEHGLLAR